MWRDYVRNSIRENRAASLSVAASALVAALLLSLLVGLFYNIWRDEADSVRRSEGGWHARIAVELNDAQLERARSDGAVADVAQTGDGVELTLRNPRRTYRELPRLAEALGLDAGAVEYHEVLLSLYLINDPNDPEPPRLVAFYLAVLLAAALSLALVIRCAFAVGMEARVRQLGVLSSVGAAPRQLRACLMREAATLTAAPVALGCALGIGLCALLVRALGAYAVKLGTGRATAFHCPPGVPLAALAVAAATVALSAWLPARRLSRVSPIAAARGGTEPRPRRAGRHRLLTRLFGAEGTLAGASLAARRRALRTSAVSLTLAALGLTMMLSFLALSQLSTQQTYFERYQGAWDVMLTLRGAKLEDVDPGGLSGARGVAAYQWAEAETDIPEERMSAALRELGLVQPGAARAPVMILDDASFRSFTGQARVDGAAVLNRFWDSAHSDFRHREYVPFVEETGETTLGGATVPVLAYVNAGPLLREEYADGMLTHFVPLSLWREIGGEVQAEPEVYVRILAREGATLEELDELEARAAARFAGRYEVESENRLRERIENDAMIRGYERAIGGLCALLALIGMVNMFAGALGGAVARRREFARYLCVRLSPGGMRKLLWIEALGIALRPLAIALPLSAAAILLMLCMSHLRLSEFLPVAPVMPVLGYAAATLSLSLLAHALAWRGLARANLTEALKRDFD